MMPIMPRTVIKEAGWSGLQRVAECSFPISVNYETNVVPYSELHDLTKKARRVFERCVSRLPPTNAPSNGSQSFRITLCPLPALHSVNTITNRLSVSSFCTAAEAIRLWDNKIGKANR
jgi:hypothetical protein